MGEVAGEEAQDPGQKGSKGKKSTVDRRCGCSPDVYGRSQEARREVAAMIKGSRPVSQR